MKVKKLWKQILCFTLILTILLSGATMGFGILSSEEDVDDIVAELGWDDDLLEAQEWSVSQGGQTYTITRESQYGRDYYDDLLTTTKQYLGILDALGGSRIAEVAKGEVGAEGAIESPPGSNNCKYTRYYGLVGAAWCAIFVTWCAEQCGYIESGIFPDLGTSYGNCSVLFHWFVHENDYEFFSMESSNVYGSADGYEPTPGDIIFYEQGGLSAVTGCGWCPSMEHVGIVVEVEDGCITTVEGNWGQQVSIRKFYAPVDAMIVHVPYPAEDGEAGIFNYLTLELGFNAAAACGILANIYVETAGTYDASIIEYGYGEGYGLCQWTGDRRARLVSWSNDSGYEYSSTQGQLDFMLWEMKTYYPGCLTRLLSVSNDSGGAYEAGYWFGRLYEGGGTFQSAEQYGVTRGNIARTTFWPKYG